jgi:hypothetical protein
MYMKFIFAFLLLAAAPVRAQVNPCIFTFPSLNACEGGNCRVVIHLDPGGVARILPDNRYGRGLALNFGPESVFDLGDNGRINFGISGGFQAILTSGTTFPACTTAFTSGSRPYTVDLTTGGWLLFTGNNRMEFKTDNHFVLGNGSKIDGRLDIEGTGTVSILSSDGDLTMPNLDISAEEEINVQVGQGDVQLGGLRSEGTDPANSGILISAGGDVEIDNVDSAKDFTVIAEGDITIGTIENAETISLTIDPSSNGVIKINGKVTTDNPLICGPPDDCSDFQVDGGGGGSGSTDCNTVSSDPNVDRPENCAGGGATGPGFVLLCVAVLYRRCRRLFLS